MSLWTTSGAWSEGMTWLENTTSASYVRDLPAAQGIGWYDIDITAIYRSWKDGSLPNNGLQLRPLTNTANQTYFVSSESTDAIHRPMLVIDPVDTGGGTGGGPDIGALQWATGGGTWTDVNGAMRIDNPTGLYLTNRATGARLLRFEGGAVTVTGNLITVEGSAVYDGFGSIAQPLLTGSFQLDWSQFATAGVLTPVVASGFQETAPTGYARGEDYRVSNIGDLTFGSLAIHPDQVTLGADIVLTGVLDLATTGMPVALNLTGQGAFMGLGTVGARTSLAYPTSYFVMPGTGWTVAMDFTEFGFLNDTVSETMYIFGRGSFATQVNGFDWTLNFDFAGTSDPNSGLLQPSSQFIRYSAASGFDVVGTLSLARADTPLTRLLGHIFPDPAGGFSAFDLSIDTIAGSYGLSATYQLPGVNTAITMGGTLSWNPLQLTSLTVGFDGVNVPIFGSPVFLNGGTLTLGDPSAGLLGSLAGQVRASFGPSTSALLRGSADLVVSSDAMSGAVSLSAKPRYLLDGGTVTAIENGQTTSNPLVTTLQTFLGVNVASVLDWNFFQLDGSLDWSRPAQGVDLQGAASALGGILTGDIGFTVDFGNSWTLQTQMSLNLPNISALGIFRGLSVAGAEVFITYTDDGNAANDMIAAWFDYSLPGFFKGSYGFSLTLDGTFSRLGTQEIALIGSWQLDPSMPWAVMSASWDNASPNAQLVVITPDGTRLSEADIAARNDITIVSEISSPYARSVAVQTPASGIWDIEVVSPDALGAVTYEANLSVAQPDVTIDSVTFDRASKLATIDLSVAGATAGTTVRLFADDDTQDANGVEITSSPLDLSGGSARFTWDYAGFTPGQFYILGVAQAPGVPVDIGYSASRVEVIAYSGTNEVYGTPSNETLFAEGVDATFDPAAAQVFRLYQATLAREPDPDGHRGWTNALIGGATLPEIAGGFINSSEFASRYGGTTTSEFVTLLYANVLGRAPDQTGLDTWASRIDSGASTRSQVVLGFSESPEFQNQTAADAVGFSRSGYQAGYTDDVFRLYRATLDRDPDQAGLLGWTDRLAQGTSLQSVANGFVASAEFQAIYGTLSNENFVRLLYQNVLGRPADTAGLDGWQAALDSGRSRAEIVIGFSQSQEFVTSQDPLLTAWGRSLGDDDYLDGEGGNDLLVGGPLVDVFKFSRSEGGRAIIADLEPWDRIVLEGFGFADGAGVIASLAEENGNTVLRQNGIEIIMSNTLLSELDATQFVLV